LPLPLRGFPVCVGFVLVGGGFVLVGGGLVLVGGGLGRAIAAAGAGGVGDMAPTATGAAGGGGRGVGLATTGTGGCGGGVGWAITAGGAVGLDSIEEGCGGSLELYGVLLLFGALKPCDP